MSITPTLPKKQNLSFEQESILETLKCYSDDDAIIIGGPGTGKSILAAYCAVEAVRNKENTLLLVFNVPIKQYISHAIIKETTAHCEVKTYLSWLWSFYNQYKFFFKRDSAPSLENYKPDWKVISGDFKRFSRYTGSPHYNTVIVDEAQDMPVELIRCLKLLSKRVICYIDPAQTLKNNKTTVGDLEALFSDPYKKELKINYRNSKQIAEAASVFSSNNLSFNFENGNGPVTRPVMWDCDNNMDLVIKNMADVIRKHYTNKSIGIILSALPDNNSKYLLMDRYCSLLKKELGDKYIFQCYKQENQGELDFGKGGIKVFTYNTVKGIDFDIALLPIIDPIISSRNSNADKNKVYVALSRGREECYLFYGNVVKKQHNFSIYDILPTIRAHKSKFDWWEKTDTFQQKYQ